MKFKTVLFPLTAALSVVIPIFLTGIGHEPLKGDYDWLKKRLEVTRTFTMEVLEAMPAEEYDYRPNSDVRTFRAQAYHIIYSIDYFDRLFRGNPNANWDPGDENAKNKEELIRWAEEQFDAIQATILAASANEQLSSSIISFLDHNAHHRGQMVSYLRMQGITPPAYR